MGYGWSPVRLGGGGWIKRGRAPVSKIKQIKVETLRVWKAAADVDEMRPVSSSLVLRAGLVGD